MLTGSFIFPLAMLPGLLSSGLNLSKLDLKFFAIFPIIGISLAFLTINNSSLPSMIISLDRENFNYFKSLPMKLNFYLRVKFHFAVFIQLVLSDWYFTERPCYLALWAVNWECYWGISDFTSLFCQRLASLKFKLDCVDSTFYKRFWGISGFYHFLCYAFGSRSTHWSNYCPDYLYSISFSC